MRFPVAPLLLLLLGLTGCAGKPPAPPPAPAAYNLTAAKQKAELAQSAAARADWQQTRTQAEAALVDWPGLVPAWKLRAQACSALKDSVCAASATRFSAHLEEMNGQLPRALSLGLRHMAQAERPGSNSDMTDEDRATARKLAAFYDTQDRLKPLRDAPPSRTFGEDNPNVVPIAGSIAGAAMLGLIVGSGH